MHIQIYNFLYVHMCIDMYVIFFLFMTDLFLCRLLQNAPTQSLLSVVNGILEESVERRNGEIPHVWLAK
jgi:hypothetical protein